MSIAALTQLVGDPVVVALLPTGGSVLAIDGSTPQGRSLSTSEVWDLLRPQVDDAIAPSSEWAAQRWLMEAEARLDMVPGELGATIGVFAVDSVSGGHVRSVTLVHLRDGRSIVSGTAPAGQGMLMIGTPDEAIAEALEFVGLGGMS